MRTVKVRMENGSKGADDGDAIRISTSDEIAGQDAPGALRVANPMAAGKFINCRGELDSFIDDAFCKSLGQGDAA